MPHLLLKLLAELAVGTPTAHKHHKKYTSEWSWTYLELWFMLIRFQLFKKIYIYKRVSCLGYTKHMNIIRGFFYSPLKWSPYSRYITARPKQARHVLEQSPVLNKWKLTNEALQKSYWCFPAVTTVAVVCQIPIAPPVPLGYEHSPRGTWDSLTSIEEWARDGEPGRDESLLLNPQLRCSLVWACCNTAPLQALT